MNANGTQVGKTHEFSSISGVFDPNANEPDLK